MRPSIRSHDYLILAGRLAWIGVTALALGLLVLSIPANLQHVDDEALFVAVRNYAAPNWMPRAALALYFSLLRYAALLVFFAMGLLVFWRRSDEPVGLLTAFVLVLLPSTVLRFGGTPEFWRLPGIWYRNLPIVDGVLAAIGVVAFAAFLYLFPDGRFVPRRLWIALALLLGTMLASGVVLEGLKGSRSWPVMACAAVAIGVVALGGQYVRYRRASRLTRQQLRWVLAGLAAYPAWLVFRWALEQPDYSLKLRGIVSFLLLHGDIFVPTVLPVALAVATLRYRLWDIDLVIRRTLTYAIVTGSLSLVFFGSVLALQRIFTGLTGQSSPIALVGSTLVIAALFAPLRRHVQHVVDRRFYRRKYDARRVLADFATVAQNETDVEKLTDCLANAVHETVQPAIMGVWLRE